MNEKADTRSAYNLYKDEFKDNPKNIKFYIYNYFYAMKSEEGTKADEKLKKTVLSLEKEKDILNEKQLMENTECVFSNN